MKLSLVAASSLALFAVACGSTTSSDPAPAPPPPAETPAATPAAPVRTLVDATVQPTSPVNLLVDPGFSLVGQQQSYSGFLAFTESDSQPFDLETTLDSRSPAGFAGGVALVKPSGATDTKSDAVVILASVMGGQGPFKGQVWFSKSDSKGKPATLATDGSAVTASLTEESPDGKGYDFAPVPDATKTVGGRTWVLYRVDVTSPLPYGGFLVLRTGTKGGQVHIAAPEITSSEVVAGAAVRSLPLGASRSRALTSYERAAIKRFKSIKPSLVPAAPKATARHL